MPTTTSNQRTLERLKEILRRDLKLGPDLPIADTMPLIGSSMDLDSLDMLLLVTHIEKEFGVKIPSQAMGQTVFENVQTLANYVESSAPAAAPRPAQAPPPVDPLSRLPHREPFRFVTAVTHLEPGRSATGYWELTGGESFFAGHFPGRPIVPGVLIGEALAQISGIAAASANAADAPTSGVLTHLDIRFDKPVIPPARVILESKMTQTLGAAQMFEVAAKLANAVVCRGSLALHLAATIIPPKDNGKP